MANSKSWFVERTQKLAVKASQGSARWGLVDEKIMPDPECRAPKGVQTPWRKSIAVHMDVMVACDFFCKTVWTPLGKQMASVLTGRPPRQQKSFHVA